MCSLCASFFVVSVENFAEIFGVECRIDLLSITLKKIDIFGVEFVAVVECVFRLAAEKILQFAGLTAKEEKLIKYFIGSDLTK